MVRISCIISVIYDLDPVVVFIDILNVYLFFIFFVFILMCSFFVSFKNV